MEYFKRGAEVEISNDDEGFRGSWFAGTVIKRLNKTKVMVEYKNIMEEGGRRRLREVLDFIQLRPPPPREAVPGEFKLGDEVDVYHNDGWWEGTITRVLKDGRFAVYFRPTKEQKKFRPSKLRLHREWVDYVKWVPPLEVEEEVAVDKEVSPLETPKPATETLFERNFSQGAQVEVRTDEEGFEGAWLSATIVNKLNEDKYLVEYHNLKNEENTEFLREEADGPNIRPQPPETTPSTDSFKAPQKVDAWFNDCWWTGEISEALDDQKYVVYFNETEEEMEFKGSKLRLHQDWVDGNWVIPAPTKAQKF